MGDFLFVFGHTRSHAVPCRSEPVLPMLTFAQTRGNTTFYEWRTGEVPKVVDRPVEEDAPPEAATEDTVSTRLTRFILQTLPMFNQSNKDFFSRILFYLCINLLYLLSNDCLFLCCLLKPALD